MIEIIKEGSYRKTSECPDCGCIFSYDPEDILIGPHQTIALMRMTENIKITEIPKYINCPFCNKELKVTSV